MLIRKTNQGCLYHGFVEFISLLDVIVVFSLLLFGA